jgi:glycine cleavage system pyridoxal-binding protein P
MLSAIGAKSLEDLFSYLPAEVRLNRALDVPPGK